MSYYVKGGGITKLSQLLIDADKNWAGMGISQIKEVVAGMVIGDIAQHDGVRLAKLSPGVASYVLTSEGPGNLVTWAPGGSYFDRFFIVELRHALSTGLFAPDHISQVNAPLASPLGVEGVLHPDWFRRQTPLLDMALAAALFTPDHDSPKNIPFDSVYPTIEIPVGGAVADDGGVQADETAEAKSGPAIDQSYIAGEDSQKAMNASTKWEAQTFTQAANSKIRYVRLKLWRTPSSISLGTVTVSIKATLAGKPDGVDLCLATLNGDTFLDTPGRYERFDFGTPVDLTAAEVYAIVIRHGSTGTLNWRCDATAPAYAGGSRVYSTNSGIAWTIDVNADFMFEEYCTVNDMTLFPVAIAVDDAYYFGHYKPFIVLIQDMGQAGTGTYTVVWEYSRVADFAACVDLDDDTDAFKNAWTREVTHTPQGDWALNNIEGMNLYWIRARCTDAGAGYGQPLGTWAKVRIEV